MSHEKLFTLYRENRLSLYKGKFLFSIIAFTVAVIILFILFHVSYVNSQERIVSIHQNFCKDIAGRLESLTVENDSTVVLDKVISDLIAENQKNTLSLLELQYNKLQSDFAILSLWAGVLMIVFLIFLFIQYSKWMRCKNKEGITF